MIESKLPDIGTTIFTIMSRLAEESRAINLSQGFPDFQPPRDLLERVSYHLQSGHNQYAPMAGVESLREAIAAKLARLYGVRTDPDAEVTVTSGATEALFCAVQAVVRPGDEAIVFDPAYDSYEPAVRLAGGTCIHIPLTPPSFGLDWERLESSLSQKTRLVVINSPNNPTGTLIGPDDLDRLATLLRPYRCYVLSDEVYEHIVFDGARHSTALAHDELAERTFAVFSFGKTYHATGWKIGYCVAPAPLTTEFRRVHQFVTFASATPLQYALADCLNEHPEHYLGLAAFYQEKRDLFRRLLADTRFVALACHGTYFQLADFSAISDREDREFARWLTTEHGVAVIPVSVFYHSSPPAGLVRFCFAKESETLTAAARRVANL
jgi:methionine aminotransferase